MAPVAAKEVAVVYSPLEAVEAVGTYFVVVLERIIRQKGSNRPLV